MSVPLSLDFDAAENRATGSYSPLIKKSRVEEECNLSVNDNENFTSLSSIATPEMEMSASASNLPKNSQPPVIDIFHFAFGINFILESVLSNLKINDLLSLRLVSERFSLFSSAELEKRLHISAVVFDDGTTPDFSYYVLSLLPEDKNENEDKQKFDRFLKTLETSEKFPCCNLTICTNLLFNPRILNLLNNQGRYIKQMKLCLFTLTLGEEIAFELHTFKKVLMGLAALDNLELETISDPFKQLVTSADIVEAKGSGIDFILPSLKFLNVDKASLKWLDILIPASPRFEKYTGKDIRFLSYFIERHGPGGLRFIQNIWINPDQSSLEHLEKLAEAMIACATQVKIKSFGLKLAKLYNCPQLWPRAGKTINKILKIVSPYVSEVLWESVGFLPGIQLPVMHNASELILGNIMFLNNFKNIPKNYFPEDFGIGKMFPKLKSISVNYHLRKTGDTPLTTVLPIDLNIWEPTTPSNECGEKDKNWTSFARKRITETIDYSDKCALVK